MATALDVISLKEAKEWLKIDDDASYTIENALITSLINSSVATIEQRVNRWLYKRDDTIVVHEHSIDELSLPAPELVVIGAKDKDGNTLTSDDYPTKKGSHYTVKNNVASFDITAGYTNCPEPLKLAVKMLITNDYEDRSIDEKYSDSDIKAKTDPFRRFTWF